MAKSSRPELEALFVDADDQQVDGAIRRALEGKIGLHRQSGRLVPGPQLFKETNRRRLLLLLLARQAQVRLSVNGATLNADATTLAKEAQVDLKSSREVLSRLKAAGLIEREENAYLVPDWRVLAVVDALVSGKE